MATYYVDPAAGGLNNGSSWADAWVSMASFFANPPAAGDICYARGTEVTGATLSNVTAGTVANPITIIGCDAAGNPNVEGSFFQIDASAVAGDGLVSNVSYVIWDGIEVFGAGQDGFNVVGNYQIFHRCYAHNNGGDGFNCQRGCLFSRCSSRNNTSDGLNGYNVNSPGCYFSDFIGNGGRGAQNVWGSMVGNIMHNNTSDGVSLGASVQANKTFVHNVVDGNGGTGLEGGASVDLFSPMYNRFTNNTGNALDGGGGAILFEDFNFFLNNGGNVVGWASTYGQWNSLAAGVEGYTNLAGDVFDLTNNATLRRTAIQVGCA